MNIIECIHYDSKCYKTAQPSKPIGIVVHSTGANNPNLKRYVQPSKSDTRYISLLNTIGHNKNNNSWNRSVNKAVHYFVGLLENGSVGVAKVLPENICAWGVGKGKNGSYNYNPTAHIQFEVCEDNLKNKQYFESCYKASVELCADICRRHGWEAKVIVSHKEAHAKGYASNHGDIDKWLNKFGKTMNDFRNDVHGLLHPTEKVKEETKDYQCIHTVVKGDSFWKLASKYLGKGSRYKEIMALNGKTKNLILPGEKLKIPNK